MHLSLKHCLQVTTGGRLSAQLCQCSSELQGIHVLRYAASVKQSDMHDQGDYRSFEEHFTLDWTDWLGLWLGYFFFPLFFAV